MAARGLPEAAVEQVRRWCAERVPEQVRDRVSVECDEAPRHLTVLECRPPWNADPDAEWTRLPVARFHYTRSTDTWALYYRDRNLRFHRYHPAPPSADIGALLAEVDRDPTAIFWG